MFDLLGRAIGGLTQLAQEKLLFDFLRGDPGMAIFMGGLIVLVLIIVPIGPAWMRASSFIGKLLAGTGAVCMIVGVLVLGLDYAVKKVDAFKAQTQTLQSGKVPSVANPARPNTPNPYPQRDGG